MSDMHESTEATLTLATLTESSIDPVEAMKLTKDPIDGMRLASDLFAMNAYRAERALARLARVPAPPPPKPISNVMRQVSAAMKVQLGAILEQLAPDERARLRQLAPEASVRLDLGDPEFTEEIVFLLAMPPAEAVAWIRERLDQRAAK
jgi:hypothetical protein